MNLASTMLLAVAMTATSGAALRPESVVLAMFGAFNRHDADGLAHLYASDAQLASSDFCHPRRGRAEVARSYRELFAEFPDVHDEIEQMVAQDDRVAVRFVARSSEGVRSLNLPISTFLVVRQGEIRSDVSTFDTGGRPCTP
ncbi:nuclear transport factor 2 family protein [Dyella terrae]|uniref:nuclear transport factor 2 family protein n=1 Tax=Dyella terrae TaxID=522259 RepID=UPI001EFC4033|nr:nuclear transport factor 2 family protein [Dyella terrae]ULU23987.1 nuclear transport factor 2 family protein [Dyella terrae]